jgi:hypothetical protein
MIEKQRQGVTLLTALCLLIGLLLIIQLWLVSAAVDALLSGERGVLVPSALVSGAIALVNGGLLWYALAFDRQLERTHSDE